MKENIKPQVSAITAFVNANIHYVKRAELISSLVFVAGLVLYILKIENVGVILTVGAVATGICYLLQSFKTLNIELDEFSPNLGAAGIASFVYKIYFQGMAVCMIALLGFSFDIQGIRTIVIIGSISAIIAIVISIFPKFKNRSEIFSLLFYLRAFVILALIADLSYEKMLFSELNWF